MLRGGVKMNTLISRGPRLGWGAFLVLALCVRPAMAQFTSSDDHFYLEGSTYQNPEASTAFYPNGIALDGVELEEPILSAPSTNEVTPPPAGMTFTSFFDVFTDITFTPIGSGPTTYTAEAVGSESITGPVSGNTYDTQMERLDISGGTLPPGVEFRIDPTTPSTGQTTIDGTGPYMISSFFDIFTDISLDGGNTWTPATGSITENLTSLPEPTGLLFLGLLPVFLMRRRRGGVA
jgi:hypothetical protein